MVMSHRRTIRGLVATATLTLAANTAQAQDMETGTVERIEVHGQSLEGNLMGFAPTREVFVYLPPSYDESGDRRYPVVYNLHGWLPDAEQWTGMIELESGANAAIADGSAREMIVVAPDANIVHEGSMYSNSVTTGNWEGFITRDLVEHIDSNYRTIASRSGRGLSGHSMGGYGTLRLGMKYPEVYSSIYAMSSCCLSPLGTGEQMAQAAEIETLEQAAEAPIFVRVALSEAAAWSPNPERPPFYFDLPYENGEEQPLVVAKWHANAPLAIIDQYVASLASFEAIGMDIGLQDNLISDNRAMHEALLKYDIAHQFETYEGNHTNRVAERFRGSVLPFFSKHLAFEHQED